jgi:glycosyltransferase involved in cell wall biosynthesis
MPEPAPTGDPDRSVSVIIPAYNAQGYLKTCVESALDQTVPPAEVIVVNDGSTDGTADVARAFGDRIVYVEQANQGQGAARNAGIARARGRFITFLDADDYWKPPFIERCVSFLAAHPDVAAVMTAWDNIIDESKTITVPPFMTASDRPREPFTIANFFTFWAENYYVQTGALMIRGDLVRQAGGMRPDLRVSQDLEYWAYLATFGAWGFIPEALFVSNSRINSRQNRTGKYGARRRLCPSVESWQQRLVGRLKPEERSGFETVRGRIAAAFVHNKILAGLFDDALAEWRAFHGAMPVNRVTRLLEIGARFGRPGWVAACQIVRWRERLKE